jgi:hypothetical protein
VEKMLNRKGIALIYLLIGAGLVCALGFAIVILLITLLKG